MEQQQVSSTPEVCGRTAAANQIPEKREVKTTPVQHLITKALSASSPCVIDPQTSPSISSSSSYASERKLPKIYVQDVEEGRPGRPGPKPGSVSGEASSTRRSLPLEAERFTPSSDRDTGVMPRRDGPQYAYPIAVLLGPDQSGGQRLSSSHSSIFSPSSDPEGKNWSRNMPTAISMTTRSQPVICHHSISQTTISMTTTTLQLVWCPGIFPQPRRGAARRISSRLRSRMCRSLGADLDQILQEEARAGGGSEAARLNRLHLISSSLSLRYDLSTSSLSSCSSPPSCHSLADLGEEHAWLVKGAAGAWPDIYTLFREDSSLLNRQDFISGFTVLHWIAKHGEHRSTCGYTPLHISAMHGHKNIMRLLVTKFSADVKLRDTAGKRPWQYLSRGSAPEVFTLLGAPVRAAGGEGGGVGGENPNVKQRQSHPRRRHHHLSFASPTERPLTMSGTQRVKRSTSIAAFLKHKSLQHFHGHQSDSSV
ncbi:hypothetical protein F7725_015229 [Dissostichus mawsoni]|uniref:Sosondowah ankyrin repeat domain family member B n=1 Tax=Dissostichus mawsoni TaxID=36200 RepID=A0A7J5YGV4_DISMA|nr:hypothetical protein F7725_015229 [Dissostichus mawsoni]